MNFGFIIDNRKCIGCHACTVACKAEHDVPIGVNRTWVKYIEKGHFPNTRRVFSVMRCNHCADAPCVEICPVEALHTREDGIVDFDNRRCIGCKACMQACPYDSLYIDPETHTAAKCNYCAHRIDIGLEPACVNICPEHAIISGDLDDPTSEISILMSREQVSARKVEKGTGPKLFYIDGDEASLNPIITEQSSTYLWNSQSTGVGHFAKYAEKRLSEADPAELAARLAATNGSEASEAAHIVPEAGENQHFMNKAMAVLKENARRVYDAPAKGAVWGWEVSAYIWTKAISAGAVLVPFLYLLFAQSPPSDALGIFAPITSLVFLTLTGMLLVKDLDQPLRFAYVLLRPQWKSWLVRGGYSITVFGGLVTLMLLANFTGWTQGLQPLSWLTAIFAVVVAVYTAFLFAQARGRDFWQSPTLPLHMLIHSVLAGAAFFALAETLLDTGADWSGFLASTLLWAVGINMAVLFFEMATQHPTQDAKATVKMILSGAFAPMFWLGVVLVGNVLPFALLWFSGTDFLPAAGVLVLLGSYITEHIWVRAPQMIPNS